MPCSNRSHRCSRRRARRRGCSPRAPSTSPGWYGWPSPRPTATTSCRPLLAPLLNQHPGLEIELAVSNGSDNLLRREADIAVRHFRPQQADLVVRKLGQTEMGLFAHADYIARYGEPVDFTLPEGAFMVGFDRDPMPIAPYVRGAPPTAPPRFRWRSDSVHALHAAVECGAAVGMYFTDIAATRPGLRRVLADRIGLTQELWLCAHDELRRSRRMRLVWDRLGDALEARLR